MMESALTEKAITNFLNDIVAFYLIKAHWDLITKRWLKDPVKYGNAWLTIFYLVFLLVRYRKIVTRDDTPARRPSPVAAHPPDRAVARQERRSAATSSKSCCASTRRSRTCASSPDIGSVTIHYDPAQAARSTACWPSLDAVIGNLAAAPRKLPSRQRRLLRRSDGPAQECIAAVEGMTCASCALLIEMKLQARPACRDRRPSISPPATVTVKGHLSTRRAFRLGREARLRGAADGHAGAAPPAGRAREGTRCEARSGKLCAGRLAHGAGDDLRHADAPLARAAPDGTGAVHRRRRSAAAASIFKKAWTLAQQREANMDTLIAMGAGAAYALQPARRGAHAPPRLFRIGRRHHQPSSSAAATWKSAPRARPPRRSAS